jgi:hypothetical protein
VAVSSRGQGWPQAKRSASLTLACLEFGVVLIMGEGPPSGGPWSPKVVALIEERDCEHPWCGW